MTFEWDEDKNRDNIGKHNVSFEAAQEAFFDRDRMVIKDKKGSKKNGRFFCVGNGGSGIMTVSFAMRNGNIRITGAGCWREGMDRYGQKKRGLH